MYRFAVTLLQPYPLLFLVMGLALARLWQRRREAWGRLVVLTAAFAALTLISLPAFSHLALGSLEWQYPPVERRPADADAIVVLSAGVFATGPTGSEAAMDEDSLRRCRHAARLYHQGGPCPVLVSGGKVDPDSPEPACARLMRDRLVELGVRPEDLIVEDASRNTYENAVESGTLLRQRGLTRPVLVADAVDLFRAVRCFRKQDVEPVPSASFYRAGHFVWSSAAFLPSPGAVRGCQRVWHEWAGVLWYRLQDRI
jgi:uncharacterized SAM-binding protein YcdF (DUF218 family)